MDIGLNYGEVLFNTTYPSETQLAIGVEANPMLHAFLNKTHQAHPDKARIKVLNNLASHEQDNHLDFYINKKSSGRSTALKTNFVKDQHLYILNF